MNVLITAPSLNVNKNVSGISAVVGTIINNNKQTNYLHFLAGKEDESITILKRVVDLVKSYGLLVKILMKNNIDLVHLNLPLNPKSIYREYLVFTLSKLFRKKVMVHLHGGKYLLEQPSNKLLTTIINRMYAGAEMIVCLSDLEKMSIEKAYHLKEVKVLENTVDDLYLNLTQTQKVSNKITVLFLGRLHESKGVNVLISAIKTLMENKNNNLHFIFCGIGPLLNNVLELEAAYPNNVSYQGIVGGEEKNRMLRNAQVFVLPSLYGEGLPMSLIEAMAAGIVPVVTNDGSMKTIVTHGENGFIVDKNSVASLTAQLEALLANPENISTVANNAKTFISTRFSIKKYINALNNYYTASIAS
jgi:glycosyltransferase involved in cell wall biosynthesis